MSHANINGKEDLDSRLGKAKEEGKLVVIDWFAPWCGPCQRIAPFYQSLAAKFPNTVFLTVDSENSSNKFPVNLIQANGVRGFPTFTFHIDGTEVERIVGANPQKLENTVEGLEEQLEQKQLAEAISLSKSQNGPTSAESTASSQENVKELPSLDGVSTVSITIKKITGDSFVVQVEENANVLLLKRRIEKKLQQMGEGNTDPAAQRLIFQGRILKDDQILSSCGIKDGFTIHISIKKTSASKTSPASTSETLSGSTGGSGIGSSASDAENRRSLKMALSALVTANGKKKAESAIFVMQLYMRNIARHPNDMKYRKIRVDNAKFSSTVKACRGGDVCMKALGFQLENITGEDYWIMQAAPNVAPLQEEIDETLRKLRGSHVRNNNSSAPLPSASASANTGSVQPPPTNPFLGLGGMGMGNMGGFPGMAGMPPMDPAAIQQMLANPGIQNMMQSPAMQNMMQSVAQRTMTGGNPLDPANIREMVQQAMSDPSMMQMISDPNIIASARAAMGGATGFNSPFDTGFNNNTSNNSGNNSNTSENSNNNNNNDNNSNSNDNDDDDDDDLDDIYAS